MSAPDLGIAVEPVSGGKAFYLPIAARSTSDKQLAKIVLRLRLTNNSASVLTLSGIVFSLIWVTTFPQGSARRWVGIARSGDWASSFWISNDQASFETHAQELFDWTHGATPASAS